MFDERLAAAGAAFEAWLADERRGVAKGPRPDPLGVVEPAGNDESQKVRDEIAALSGALAQAKGREGERDAARGEIERLTGELAAERAARAAQEAALSDALGQGKTREDEFEAARERIERLTRELAAEQANSTDKAAPISALSDQAQAREVKLDAAQVEIERRSGESGRAGSTVPGGDVGKSWALGLGVAAATIILTAGVIEGVVRLTAFLLTPK